MTPAPAHRPADHSEPVLDTTVAGILRQAAAEHPETVALVVGGPVGSARREWTYVGLCEEAERAAAALGARFSPGERVAAWGPSLPESLILSYGAAMARLVLVPVNPALRRAELTHILSQSGAAGVFLAAEHRGVPLDPVLASARADLPELREVVRFDDWPAFVGGGGPPAAGGPAPDDVAQLVYTSGTTGAPKGARLTHRGLTNAARFGGRRFGIGPGDVYVMTMPLCHVGGQVVSFQICQAGATNVLMPAFDAGLHLELIERYGATHTAGVPTMLLALTEHPDFERRQLGSLRSVSSGGAVVPADLVRQIESSLGVRFTIAFGQTETCGFISQTHLDDTPEDKAATLGRPLPQLDVRVVAPEDGQVVCGDAVGELQVRGYNVMAGYHDLPEASAEAVLPDGWLRTGDLVSLDARGYLRIVGRVKDMIVTGGENVFPAEVEAVLGAHPTVSQAAVLGLPDRRWGEMVAAVVVPAPDAAVDLVELEQYARERLAGFKVPKRWRVADSLPLTVSGKVQKFILREEMS